jgi:hypothetical protein
MRTRPGRDPQNTAHCVYSIPCECGRNYICETSKPLAARIREHGHNLTEVLLEKSRLAHRAFEEDHRIGWNKVKILQIDSNSREGNTGGPLAWPAGPTQSTSLVWKFHLFGIP